MKKPDRRKENRKKAAGALAGLGLAVFFFILLFGFGKADPENPMENTTADASHMYLTSSTLAMDKEKRFGKPGTTGRGTAGRRGAGTGRNTGRSETERGRTAAGCAATGK